MTEEKNNERTHKLAWHEKLTGTKLPEYAKSEIVWGVLTGLALPAILGMYMGFTVPKIQQTHKELDPLVMQTADRDHNRKLSYDEIRDVYRTIGRDSYSIGELVLTLPEKVDYLDRMGVEHSVSLPLPRELLSDNHAYAPKIDLSMLAKGDLGISLDETVK